MYVVVRLLKGFPQPLIYKVPAHLNEQVGVGRVVEVPLKQQYKPAVILRVCKTRPDVAYDIRDMHSMHAMPDDSHYQSFLETLAHLHFTKPLHFYQRLRTFLSHEPKEVRQDEAPATGKVPEVTLTDEQQKVVDALAPCVKNPRYTPALLHGVTGSGKTEVYKALMNEALGNGKTVLFLCPEVSLARQFEQIFRAQLSQETNVGGLHSASTKKQREKVWQWAVSGQAAVIVGVHLPALLPLSNLGLIVVDEEHEPGFSEKKHPKVNSKHAALLRARTYGVPILLGSATPSVATLHHACSQNWQQFSLTKRFSGAFPKIEHVLLSGNKKRPHFWFSPELIAALQDTLFREQQAIIYLNRRGYSFFAQCTHCGYIFECQDCAVSLTVHMVEHVGGPSRELRCHYCDFKGPLPRLCGGCNASTNDIKDKGIGTQQVVCALQKILPNARIARADTDVSRRKKEWATTMEQFSSHELDILVGTQIITKGYHFARVTLVGVIWADSSVHFPVYNAHETALQQLIQVAGRAGRVATSSRVIIQSFDNHEIFNFLDEQRYLEFATQELQAREELMYPPFGRMITVEVAGSDERRVAREAATLGHRLRERAGDEVVVLGPAAPVVAKVQRTHYRQLIVKAETFTPLYALVDPRLWQDLKCSVHAVPG